MAKGIGAHKRKSGTGQDTYKMFVPVPSRFPLRPTGRCGTLSRPVPLSRIGWLRGHPKPLIYWSLAIPSYSHSVLHEEAL
jgi:hypothetical protein